MDAYSSFRIRDYRLLIAATFLSGFGLQMLSVAISWDLYIQTKSAVVLGNVGFVQVAPFLLFALFAGNVADRYDRRRIMIFTQILYLIASGLLVFGFRSVGTIYACLFFTASARAFQWPARLGLLPHLVPGEILQNAITWNSSVQEIASVAGPAAAGIMIATIGSRSVYILHVVFALLTLLCYLSFHYRGAAATEDQPRDLRSLLEGVRFVWHHKLILPAISLDLFGVLFGGATALLPVLCRRHSARGRNRTRLAARCTLCRRSAHGRHDRASPEAPGRRTQALLRGRGLRCGHHRIRLLPLLLAFDRHAAHHRRMRQHQR